MDEGKPVLEAEVVAETEAISVPQPAASILVCRVPLSGSGKRCGLPTVDGRKVCARHVGKGRPPTHGIYSRFFSPRSNQIHSYNNAKVGSLDDEIRLIKSKIAWATEQWISDPEGGIPVAQYKGSKIAKALAEGIATDRADDAVEQGEPIRIRLWIDVVGELVERARALEKTHFDITVNQPEQGKTTVNVLVTALAGMTKDQQIAYLTDGIVTVGVGGNGHQR